MEDTHGKLLHLKLYPSWYKYVLSRQGIYSKRNLQTAYILFSGLSEVGSIIFHLHL